MHNNLLIILLLGCILVSGCALGSRSGSGNMQSYDGVSANYVADGQTLASQAALELARRYPPARTYLGLMKTDTPFGQRLEADLRSQGFMVSTDAHSAPLKVSYTLDEVQGESLITCYLQIRLSDGERFGTVHQLNALLDAPSATTPSVLLQDPVYTPPAIEEKPLPATAGASPVSTALAVAAHTATSEHSGHGQQSRTVYSAPPPFTVHTKGTAAQVAQRNNVPVVDFCRWNQIQPGVVIQKGQHVYLHEPPTTTITAEPIIAKPSVLPVPAPASMPAPAQQNPLEPVAAPLPMASAPVATPVEPAATPLNSKASSSTPLVAASVPAPLSPAPAENPKETAPTESAPTPEISTWTIEPGNLQAQLSAWSAQASYQLIWKTQNDFEMESHARFQGDFMSAIRQLFAGLHRSGHALRVTLYQGNNVIEVSEE